MVADAALRPQVTFDELQDQAQSRHLTVLGGFHPTADDNTPEHCETLLLLGPHEPAFWPALTDSPEWWDHQPDPVDRWSARVIGTWAETLDAQAMFPFGGPPYLPFFSWATRTGRIHVSPIMLLVHDQAGLFVSFRAALALPYRVDLPKPPANPCLSCADKPCKSSCPVDAFKSSAYDVPACKEYLGTGEGEDCMTQGCAARRACPVSGRYPRLAEQSAYHMTMFKG